MRKPLLDEFSREKNNKIMAFFDCWNCCFHPSATLLKNLQRSFLSMMNKRFLDHFRYFRYVGYCPPFPAIRLKTLLQRKNNLNSAWQFLALLKITRDFDDMHFMFKKIFSVINDDSLKTTALTKKTRTHTWRVHKYVCCDINFLVI